MISWFPSKLVLVAAAAALVVAGCGGDDGAAEPTSRPTTTRPSTTLSQEEQDEAELEELAVGWYRAIKAIYRDGEDVSLADDYLTGEYLEGFRGQVSEFRSSGHAVKIDERSGQTVESVVITEDEGVVIECVVDADVLIDAETGEVLNDAVVADRYETQASRTSAGWRFGERKQLSENRGETECLDG